MNRTKKKLERDRQKVIDAAIAFYRNEDSQMSAAQLEGSNSMDYPVQFMHLMDAVRELLGEPPRAPRMAGPGL